MCWLWLSILECVFRFTSIQLPHVVHFTDFIAFHSLFRFHPNWSLYTLCVYVFFIVKSRSSCRLSVIRVLFMCTLSVCAYLFAFSVKYHLKCHFYTGILFFRVDNVSFCAFRMWEGVAMARALFLWLRDYSRNRSISWGNSVWIKLTRAMRVLTTENRRM